jgi:hypothetical protein
MRSLNPLHASGEFGIAQAYQQSGNVAQARSTWFVSTLLKGKLAPYRIGLWRPGKIFVSGRISVHHGESVASDSRTFYADDGCRRLDFEI